MGKVKSECSSQTMITVPPFLTKRNLLQTNIFRNRVSDPSYFAAQSCLEEVPKTPKRCTPDTSIVRMSTTVKPAGECRPSSGVSNSGIEVSSVEDRSRNSKNKPKFDEKMSSEHTLWGWTEDKGCSKDGFSSNVGNVKATTGKDSARKSVPSSGGRERGKHSPNILSCLQTSEDKMVSTDDDSMFLECEAISTSAENDFRDDCPVNYSHLNAAVEKEGARLVGKSTHEMSVGDTVSQTSANILQRFCAGMSHDASSPFNTSLAFCKTGLGPDCATRQDDPPARSSRQVNPSTSTSTYLHVAPVDGLKKPDRSLDGICGATTQPYKTRLYKRKMAVPTDYSFIVDKTPCDENSHDVQKTKRVHKDRIVCDEPNLSHGQSSRYHKSDAVSRRIQELNNYNRSKTGPVNTVPKAKAPNFAHRGDEGNSTRRQSINALNFYDVLDCKSKDVEELFNFHSSFETASSEASQASFRSATEGNHYRNIQDRRGLHSEPRGCGSKDAPFYSGSSSMSSSHRNSSLKFDPDVLKSTFSVSLENGSPLLNTVHHLRTGVKNYSRDTLNASVDSSVDKMELHRRSGKCMDMYGHPDSRVGRNDRPSSCEVSNQNDEYMFQVSSPRDVLMMSLQTFKGLNISDACSRHDCEKFLGQKTTGEKLNNFIKSRTIFNSVSFVRSESLPLEGFADEVKISDENVGLGFRNEDAASGKRSGQSILQCIYKSQHF